MNLLLWIVFGLIAGALGKFFMPGDDPKGWIVTILLGIGGAIVGGYIGSLLGMGDPMQFNCSSMVLAVLGTCTLLAVYRLIKRR